MSKCIARSVHKGAGQQLMPRKVLGQRPGVEEGQHAGDGGRAHVAQAPGIDRQQGVGAAAFGRHGRVARPDRCTDQKAIRMNGCPERAGSDVTSHQRQVALPQA